MRLDSRGRALGAALRAPVHVPAFAKVKNDLLGPAPNRPAAWNRLALLKEAHPPTEIRSAVARTLVLDAFTRMPYQEWRAASIGEAKALGLPADLVTLGLELLATDGAAARHAFAEMGGDGAGLGQADKMRRFLEYARWSGHGDDIADAFGRVIEAGAGVHAEEPGRHSLAAGAFALDAIKAAGAFGDTIPSRARDSMANLAKSYIHELASGARFDKAVYRESGMIAPNHWKHILGVTPSFYLSPGDTYRFFSTFVGDEALTDDFDSAAARFRHDTLSRAARADALSDEERFESASKMFGDLAALEFKATMDVRGERDATDDLVRNFVKNTASLGIDKIPVASGLIEAGWDVTKAYVISTQLDGWAESFETRVERLTGARSDFVLRQKYDLAHILHSASYPADNPPAELISKTTGDLKTYDELLQEAKQEAAASGKKWEQVLRAKLTPYETWMDRNEKFDDKVENASNFQTSERPKEEIRIWN